jgi:hypothetical protein
MATTTVLTVIKIAPTAGLNTKPCNKETPQQAGFRLCYDQGRRMSLFNVLYYLRPPFTKMMDTLKIFYIFVVSSIIMLFFIGIFDILPFIFTQ